MHLEEYAIIGDLRTAALVSRGGSIDWLCFPRFDSGACFAALLGTEKNGFFRIAPIEEVRPSRRYRDDSLVLETRYETSTGVVTVIDCMPVGDGQRADVLRLVRGESGRVPMRMELAIRFDYGQAVPWVRRSPGGMTAISGPDMLRLHTPVPISNQDFRTVAELEVSAGEQVPFHLGWSPSTEIVPDPIDCERAIEQTDAYWRAWAARCTYRGKHRDAVMRSLLTLKALTYEPTGAIAAAVTTSLPELIGGVRNWDYRYCWIRDATLTLFALLQSGFTDEARDFVQWLLRAAAGHPDQMQIMYGLSGERRLTEFELPELAGYEGSRPVRVGNHASTQRQLDVYGELMDAIHTARRYGVEGNEDVWDLQKALLASLERQWRLTDSGLWEMRGPERHYTHSKVMAWVAFDRAIRSVERFDLDGPVERWRDIRTDIHADVCAQGYDERMGSFTQSYGSPLLDASLLLLPLVGFLPASDERIAGTVHCVRDRLYRDGFVQRYETLPEVDGLPPGEGAFITCTFWLVDALVLLGETSQAEEIFERLLGLRNDVGLLSEEYDTERRRLVGNVPQAFSHVGLINSARNLFKADKPANERPKG